MDKRPGEPQLNSGYEGMVRLGGVNKAEIVFPAIRDRNFSSNRAAKSGLSDWKW